jgi:hypothetical protein
MFQPLKELAKSRLKLKNPVDAGFTTGGMFSVYGYLSAPANWYEAIGDWRQSVVDQLVAGARAWESEGSEVIRRLRAGELD